MEELKVCFLLLMCIFFSVFHYASIHSLFLSLLNHLDDSIFNNESGHHGKPHSHVIEVDREFF